MHDVPDSARRPVDLSDLRSIGYAVVDVETTGTRLYGEGGDRVMEIAVIHVGFLNVAFGTVPLDSGQWLVCVAMASAVLWFAELRKLLVRALRGRAGDAGTTRV